MTQNDDVTLRPDFKNIRYISTMNVNFEKIDKAIDKLREKFGYEIINRGSILKEIYEEDN